MKRFVGEGFAGCTCYDCVSTEQIFANLNISRNNDRQAVENVNTYTYHQGGSKRGEQKKKNTTRVQK